MDHSYPYIASLTREPFLFYEMRSTAKLRRNRRHLLKMLADSSFVPGGF